MHLQVVEFCLLGLARDLRHLTAFNSLIMFLLLILIDHGAGRHSGHTPPKLGVGCRTDPEGSSTLAASVFISVVCSSCQIQMLEAFLHNIVLEDLPNPWIVKPIFGKGPIRAEMERSEQVPL